MAAGENQKLKMLYLVKILSEETGIPVLDITKNGGDSYLLSDSVAAYLKEGTAHE